MLATKKLNKYLVQSLDDGFFPLDNLSNKSLHLLLTMLLMADAYPDRGVVIKIPLDDGTAICQFIELRKIQRNFDIPAKVFKLIIKEVFLVNDFDTSRYFCWLSNDKAPITWTLRVKSINENIQKIRGIFHARGITINSHNSPPMVLED